MRIRTIKPEFWMHEGLCSCSEFTRLLALALLNWADDHGYFMANPVLIRGQLFPFLDDSEKVPRSIQDLSRVGWIELGTDPTGRSLGRIINFAKHQRVDKPKPSTIRDLWQFLDESKTNPRRIQDASQEEGKGKEGNWNGNGTGKGNNGASASLFDLKAYASEIGVPESDGEFMFDHWESNGWRNGANKVKCWKAGFRKWKASGWLPSQKQQHNGKRTQTFAGIQEDIPLV